MNNSFLEETTLLSVLHRKNELAFRLTIVFIIFAIPYVPIFALQGWYIPLFIVLWTIFLFGLSIGLNKLLLFKYAKFIMIAGASVSFALCADILGPAAGAQYLLFAMAPLPLLVYDNNERFWITYTSLIPILGYLLLEWAGYKCIEAHYSVSEDLLKSIRILAVSTTFFMLMSATWIYFLINRDYENKLVHSNNTLRETAISEKNLRIISELQNRDLKTSAELIQSLSQQATLGAIMRGIVHEVKSPLTSLRAACSIVLMDSSLSESSRNSVQNMLGHIKHLNDLSRTLLADAGAIMWTDAPIDLRLIVEQVIKLCDNEGFVRKIKLTVQFPDTMPPIKGTPAYISQALINLMVNALRFSPDESEISTTISTVPGWILIDVADQGPGISEVVRDSLFQPGVGTGESSSGNAGLGLFFVKRVVDAHGGTIEVQKTDSFGSTFRMKLPTASDLPSANTSEHRNLPKRHGVWVAGG